MTWIAIADREDALFCASGLAHLAGDRAADSVEEDREMERGSLLMETELSPDDRPQLLWGAERGFEHKMSLTIRALPGAGITLVHTRHGEMLHAALTHDTEARRTAVLRITYSWDRARNWARLVVERPDVARSFQVTLKEPVRMMLSDVREMIKNPAARTMAPDVLFVAVSDRIEPIGPMPGMTGSTPIVTPQGPKPLGELRRGDLVETLSGDIVPVLHVVRRTVPARGLFEPVRLRHPYFGLESDIVVAPGQRLVVGGSRVEYLFGTEQVLVPSAFLIKGSAAVREKGHSLVTYTQVLLPNHEAILAAGIFVESLNIGRIRRKPEILNASLLGQLPRHTLPEHSSAAFPVLGDFEAIVLAEERAA